jgi:hypothetical protein
MKTKRLSWETTVALGLFLASVVLYVIHFACFRDWQYLWLSSLTNLAFLPISVLVVTVIIGRLLSARERAMRRDKLRMLISVFFSSLGNRLLEILFRCDSSAPHFHQHLRMPEPRAGMRPVNVKLVVTGHSHTVSVEHADLEELRTLLTHKMDILLRLLENPSLHEHESFAELLRTVFHLTEELSLKEDFYEVSHADIEHLTADVNRCYGLLVQEWSDYLYYLEANYPYLFSLAIRTSPLSCCLPEAECRDEPLQPSAA